MATPGPPPYSRRLKCDQAFTERVVAATGPRAHARLAAIMPSLVRHLHDFARDVGLTVAEYAAALDLINECGRLSNERENHTQLLTGILGLETLVDDITSSLLADDDVNNTTTTPSAILGPFYRAGAPFLPHGGSLVRQPAAARGADADAYAADAAHVSGRVLATETGAPVAGAVLDLWQAAPNAQYEQPGSGQAPWNLRGRLRTDAEGRYAFCGLRPVSYPIPRDGPAGRVLAMLDRDPHRPGHLHVMLTAPGRRTLVTQLFDARDAYLGHDSVFADDNEALVVEYKARVGDDKARWTLEYDFKLAPTGGA